jgi:hypothetical protein
VGRGSRAHPLGPLAKTPLLALYIRQARSHRQTSQQLTAKRTDRMENGAPQNEGRDPSGFLSQIIGNAVTVKLNSGIVYKGELEPKPACCVCARL